MPTVTPLKDIKKTVKIWHKMLDKGFPATAQKGVATAVGELHRALNLGAGNNHTAVTNRLNIAAALGVEVRDWSSPLGQLDEAKIRRRYGVNEVQPGASPVLHTPPEEKTATRSPPRAPGISGGPLISGAADALDDLVKRVIPTLRKHPATLEQLAGKLGTEPRIAEIVLGIAVKEGAVIEQRGDLWHLDDAPRLGIDRADKVELLTDADGYLEFAACGDQHLGSKYERIDCLEDYYDQIQRRGIKIALNAGNWIDGEASFNKHDLLVHGFDNQMQYLARHYPKRDGVKTLAITGADHEGWYARREGIDVGRYAENVMRENGRTDWQDMGYMEAFLKVVHSGSGKSSMLSLMHPGGGSSYAVSYAPQKIVEGFDGGDKPAVLLIGHYHKSGYNTIRNVHTMQTGCFQDQTVFMRQKKLSAHVGGAFVKIHVDPHTGAVDECSYTFRNYFVRDYYNGRWSQHGTVNLTKRVK